MSKKQDSNVIHIDFNERKALQKSNGTHTFSQLIGDIVTPTTNDLDEWPEDLTPQERREQLKQDLDFLRKMSDIPPTNRD